MKPPAKSSVSAVDGNPRLISMRCHVAEPGTRYAWHDHPFEEFTLVTDDQTVIAYPWGVRPTRKDTLLLYHRGEKHGACCSNQQAPRFWVVHFTANPALYRVLDRLGRADPAERVWELCPEKAAAFRWFFLQIFTERTQALSHCKIAESSWLRLLLVSVQRWAEGKSVIPLAPKGINSETIRLWHLVNALVGKPEEFARKTQVMPNYDSLRHAFKRAFGCSPREMMSRLRVQQAKNLLLETTLSIKEISERVGFHRQHEFTRSFHQTVGMAPSEWRDDPLKGASAPPEKTGTASLHAVPQ